MRWNRTATGGLPVASERDDQPLRVAIGLLFHPRSPFAVSGYTAYTTRVIRVLEESPVAVPHPWTEPGPHVLGRASSVGAVRAAHRVLERSLATRERPPITAGRAPESLLPDERYSPPNERRIEGFRARMEQERIDVFHITDWSTVGTLLFEACRRAQIPIVVSAVDYKPICAQTQLLENDRDVCEGPTSNERCVACSWARGWQATTDEIARRQEALGQHLFHAAHIVAFTQTHVRELDRWLGFGEHRYSVIPFAVPAPGPGFAKDPDAFEHPLRFAFLARASHEWGLEALLEAWRMIAPSPSSAVLEVYTDWRFEAQGMALRFAPEIEQGSVCVHVGSVFDRIDDIHRGTAAVVVPSQWKNTGSAGALEALERRTPVITENRHGVFDDLPQGMRGLAYESGDVHSLAAVLEATIKNPERLARASRDSPFHRSFDDHVRALGDLYGDAVHGARAV